MKTFKNDYKISFYNFFYFHFLVCYFIYFVSIYLFVLKVFFLPDDFKNFTVCFYFSAVKGIFENEDKNSDSEVATPLEEFLQGLKLDNYHDLFVVSWF